VTAPYTGPGRSRVLAIHRYYWPDTPPYASLLRTVVERWADRGHRVEVLSTQPSYKPELDLPRRPAREQMADVVVRRIALAPDRTSTARRLWNMVWFPLGVVGRILVGPRYAVVMCSTAPPIVLGWAVSLAARVRGARFVYHCMDIHPEIGALSGEFGARPVFAVLRRLDIATCRRAAAVVVLSDDMRDALLARDPVLATKIEVLNNFDLPSHSAGGSAVSPLPAGNRVRLVFAGNIGRFQGLEDLTRAVLEPRPELDQLELVFMGEGAAKQGLVDLVAQASTRVQERVVLLPHGSAAEARALVATATLGVVSLTPDVIRYAYPSKTATYLSEGTPVLALVETDSQLARQVTEEGHGFAVAPGDLAGLAAVLDRVVTEDPADSESRRKAARAAWERDYAADVLLPRWDALLDRLLHEET
jgi:glycosyltransferase involved in cell wall biosynthesis